MPEPRGQRPARRPFDRRPGLQGRLRLLACLAAALSLTLMAASSAMAAIPPVRGVTYGPMAGELVTIFPTKAAPVAAPLTAGVSALPPTVLLVHGGGWRTQFSETEQPTVAQGLRAKGFAVFDINYPQANIAETAFPKQPEALQDAIEFAHENAASYGGDPENIVLVGGSAGGHLVDVAGEQAIPYLRAVVSLSGPTNLPALLALATRQELKQSLGVSLAIALGCGPEATGLEKVLACGPANLSLAEQFSPVSHVPKASCPHWLLFSAEEDLVPLSQQQEFLAALKARGCSASLQVEPGKGHSFGYWPEANAAIYSFIAGN